jgi:hypothetical protein
MFLENKQSGSELLAGRNDAHGGGRANHTFCKMYAPNSTITIMQVVNTLLFALIKKMMVEASLLCPRGCSLQQS